MGENLLHDEIDGPRRLLSNTEAIAPGVQKPIDMIDAQPIDDLLLHQSKDQRMGSIEQFGQLHANPREVVHIEEAPVVDVVVSDAKISKSPELPPDQVVETAPAFENAGPAFERRDRARDRGGRVGRGGGFRQRALKGLRPARHVPVAQR